MVISVEIESCFVVVVVVLLIIQHLAPDNLLPEIKPWLGDEVESVTKLAVVVLLEQKMGQVLEIGLI